MEKDTRDEVIDENELTHACCDNCNAWYALQNANMFASVRKYLCPQCAAREKAKEGEK